MCQPLPTQHVIHKIDFQVQLRVSFNVCNLLHASLPSTDLSKAFANGDVVPLDGWWWLEPLEGYNSNITITVMFASLLPVGQLSSVQHYRSTTFANSLKAA